MEEVEAVEVGAVEDVVVGRGEGAVGDPRGEAPPCPLPSRVEEEEEEPRERSGAERVVETGLVLGMSLM